MIYIFYFSQAGDQSTRDNFPASQPPFCLRRQSHFYLRQNGGNLVVVDSVREAATNTLFEITGARTSTKILRVCVCLRACVDAVNSWL